MILFLLLNNSSSETKRGFVHLRRPKPIFLLFFSVSSGSSAFFFSFSFPFPLFFSFFLVLVFFFLSFLPFSSVRSPAPWRDELLAGVSRPELRSEPSSASREDIGEEKE